jgi:hypothetical protein
VSLNSCEQRVFDYLELKTEERDYWFEKVHTITAKSVSKESSIQRLDSELWNYYVERCNVVTLFKEAARREGLNRTSMRNLAELLTRVWVEPDVKKVSTSKRK